MAPDAEPPAPLRRIGAPGESGATNGDLVQTAFHDARHLPQTDPESLESIVRDVETLARKDLAKAAVLAARSIYGLTVANEEGESVALRPEHLPLLGSLFGTVMETDSALAENVFERIPEDLGVAIVEERIDTMLDEDPDAVGPWIDNLEHDLAEIAKWNLIRELHAEHGQEEGFERYPKTLLRHNSDILEARQRFGVVESQARQNAL